MPSERGGLLLMRVAAQDENGNSALHYAAQNGNLNMIEYLVTVDFVQV